MQVNIQPWACKAAWAAEFARKQGKFWPFHNVIFTLGLKRGEETIMQIRKLGMSCTDVVKCLGMSQLGVGYAVRRGEKITKEYKYQSDE